MTEILIPAILLGVMGILFGVGLGIASKKLAVEVDERLGPVRNCLPGANCGACGYPGCDGYAAAIVNEGAPINACVACGDEGVQKIGEIMGMTAEAGERRVANILCRGATNQCGVRFSYQGISSCRALAMTSEGDKSCRYACMGLGDCAKVCPVGAIHVTKDRLAYVEEDKCIGCGKCVAACPKNVIRLEPHYKVRVKCRAMEKGKVVRDHCKAGCIGCGKCEKSCKFEAITMHDNLPVIDRERCVGCLDCARNCPTGAMWAELDRQPKARIHTDACVGCTLCARQCKFDAIEGAVKQAHRVDWDKCTGCGLCTQRCPKKAIEMILSGSEQ